MKSISIDYHVNELSNLPFSWIQFSSFLWCWCVTLFLLYRVQRHLSLSPLAIPYTLYTSLLQTVFYFVSFSNFDEGIKTKSNVIEFLNGTSILLCCFTFLNWGKVEINNSQEFRPTTIWFCFSTKITLIWLIFVVRTNVYSMKWHLEWIGCGWWNSCFCYHTKK